MNSGELVRMIREQDRPLVEGHYGELRTNLGTSHYHRLSNEELFRRGQAVLQRLGDWLTSRDPAAIHCSGTELGKQRFAEGIPLGQVVLALILEEQHLWSYATQQGIQPAEELRLEVAEFFARTIYSTALGYEESLAESNRRARRAIVPPKPAEVAARAVTSEENPEMVPSRGGQVGEFGG